MVGPWRLKTIYPAYLKKKFVLIWFKKKATDHKMCHLNCFYTHSSLVLSTFTLCSWPSELAKLKLYTHRKTPIWPTHHPSPRKPPFLSMILSTLCFARSLQSCLTLGDPVDCSPPGSSVHGIPQAGILEWVAMPSSRGSSQSRDWTHDSRLPPWQAGSLPLAPPGKKYLLQALGGTQSMSGQLVSGSSSSKQGWK